MLSRLKNQVCKRKLLQVSLALLCAYMVLLLLPLKVLLEAAFNLTINRRPVSLETFFRLKELKPRLQQLKPLDALSWHREELSTVKTMAPRLVIRRPPLRNVTTRLELKDLEEVWLNSQENNTRMNPVDYLPESTPELHPYLPFKRVLDSDDAIKVEKFQNYLAKYKIKEHEKELLRTLLDVFDKTMTKHNLTYFLIGGSLIGSYRHHDMPPWDDDLDVFAPSSLQVSMYSAFVNLKPEFTLSTVLRFWKLYSKDSKPFTRYKWSWPFIDIFFYTENETHIWEQTHVKKYIWPKSVVFPLRRKPFMGLLPLVPRDSYNIIQRDYDISMCHTGSYSHSMEGGRESESIPCSLLYSLYPFVTRNNVLGGCNETLEIGEKIIGHYVDNGFPC